MCASKNINKDCIILYVHDDGRFDASKNENGDDEVSEVSLW